MSFTFRPAKRENVPLLIGLAGGTGSGKTLSAMKLAKGLSGDQPFAVVDTENGRAKHYADDFRFDVTDLAAPFSPARYGEAIAAAASTGYGVIVVDSMSHEHAGDGGLLDMHDAEFERMGGRDSVNMAAWIKPKSEHKKLVTRLLQIPAHVIICFRAEQKVEMKKDADGKWQVVPKQSLVGLDGWIPISEKNLPYELTISFLLTADQPGIPKPIKLQEQHRPLIPLDQPISEETGKLLASWALGAGEAAPRPGHVGTEAQTALLNEADARKVEPLTPEAFKRLCDSEGLTKQKVGSIGRSLYPGRNARDLTDEERGRLWREIENDLRSVAV